MVHYESRGNIVVRGLPSGRNRMGEDILSAIDSRTKASLPSAPTGQGVSGVWVGRGLQQKKHTNMMEVEKVVEVGDKRVLL
jgi:hypothetical protein